MKKFLFLIVSATAVFWGCSDSSSTSSSSSNVIEHSGSITVDEKNQIAVTTFQRKQDLCVYDNFEYTWKTVDFGNEIDSIKYEFLGDTLILFVQDDGEFVSSGGMYVGGKNGNINGTWKQTLCYYNSKYEETYCYTPCSSIDINMPNEEDLTEEELLEFYENHKAEFQALEKCIDDDEFADVTIKISGSSIKSTVVYNYSREDDDFDDYMNSEYMADFYYAISNDGSTPSIWNINDEDSTDVQKYIERAGIEIVSQTKKSVTFKVGDQSVSVNVKTLSYDEESSKLEMSVTMGTKVCELSYESGEVTKSTCSAENGEYFDKDYEYDENDNKIYYADYIEKSNRKEYNNCLKEVIDSLYTIYKSEKDVDYNEGDDETAWDISGLAKKSSPRASMTKDEFIEFNRKQTHVLKKFAE